MESRVRDADMLAYSGDGDGDGKRMTEKAASRQLQHAVIVSQLVMDISRTCHSAPQSLSNANLRG